MKSSWLRANLIERARKAVDVPVEHVEVDLESPRERTHVLVIANQTVLGEPLLAAIRERSEPGPPTSPSSFQPTPRAPSAAPRGLRAHGQPWGSRPAGSSALPIPVVAAQNAVHDDQIDEIIVSTFPEASSGWLSATSSGAFAGSAAGQPVVVIEAKEAEAAAAASS